MAIQIGQCDKTTLVEVTELILTRIEEVLEFPSERVILVARDGDEDEPPTQTEQVVKVRVTSASPDSVLLSGAGRHAAVEMRRFRCILWTRCELDEKTQDRVALLDLDRGHFIHEHYLKDALIHFQPTKDNGRWVAEEPIVPRATEPPRRTKKNRGWTCSGLEFEVSFVLDIDESYL